MPRILDYTKINWEEEFSFDAPLHDINGEITGEGPIEAGNEIFLCLRCRVDEVERYEGATDNWHASISFLNPVSIEALSENSQMQLIRQLTQRLSAPLRSTELYQLFEGLLTDDSGTKIANRIRFDVCLEREWRRGQREQTPMSLILYRIEGLQLSGAEDDSDTGLCLRQIADLLRSSAKRTADVVARYQENTFALLLPNTPQTSAAQLATSIEQQILKVLSDTVPQQQYGLSVGVAGLTPTQDSAATMLTDAVEKSLETSSDGN